MSTMVENKNKRLTLLSIFSGTIVAVSCTLIMILGFAFIIRFLDVNDSWIFPINQVIKAISLFIGAIVFIKKHNQNGFLKGIIMGLSYFILSFVVFSILQGSFAFSINNLYDLLLTTLMGGIIGIIVVHIIKR